MALVGAFFTKVPLVMAEVMEMVVVVGGGGGGASMGGGGAAPPFLALPLLPVLPKLPPEDTVSLSADLPGASRASPPSMPRAADARGMRTRP